MTFVLGKRSVGFMEGLHPVAVQVITLGISLSTVDFGITEPQVRTIAEQRAKVAAGVSKTMKSNHLEQVDLTGKTRNMYGHAVDLVPWIDGKFVWDWQALYSVAAAMAEAGRRVGVLDRMCWGGVWSRWMGEYATSAEACKVASQAYVAQRRAADKPAFIDGPHFQFFKRG